MERLGRHLVLSALFAAAILMLMSAGAQAKIHGVEGNTFNLTARDGYISTPDGNSIYTWGYANGNGPMQYPGVTMIVNQGDTVTVNLTNTLPVPVSIVFPGQEGVEATGGAAGLLAAEAATGETVTYTFVATRPGTYHYHSGTMADVQVEMGLVGALIVRPAGYDGAAPRAYGHPGSDYDYETLFLLTEMDSRIHEVVETQGVAGLAGTGYLADYFPNYWFINGRNAPDTMAAPGVSWLPTQPYNCMPRISPGQRLLMRVISAGRDLHPYHHHGNNASIIARDGSLLESVAGAGPDLAASVFTIQAVPGSTTDAIFEWTGKGLGWDIYGTGEGYDHQCVDGDGDGYDDTTREYCADHGKPFPVALPEGLDLTFGGAYSGSPFLGVMGSLPPGEGGLNPNAGYFYMWHSHTEKEMTNYDIFPGGMMTMFIVEPHGVPIQ